MCLHDPSCWNWPGHRRAAAVKKRTRPPPTRISARASRTKLQDALVRYSSPSTLVKHTSGAVPLEFLDLQPSDKLSNHPDLVRDMLARSFAFSSHSVKEKPVWDPLLALLKAELPSNTTTTNDDDDDNATSKIWSSAEVDTMRRGRILRDHIKIVLHPIWDRFPGEAHETRTLIADAFLAPAVTAGDQQVVELLLGHGADRNYAPPHGYPSAFRFVANKAPRDENQARMLLTMMMPRQDSGTRGEFKQMASPEDFEKVSEYWRSEKGRTMMSRIRWGQRSPEGLNQRTEDER